MDSTKLMADALDFLCAGFLVNTGHGFCAYPRRAGRVGSSEVLSVNGVWWTVCDNGGELNVERVNDPESMRSMPYTDTWGTLDPTTMAYRIWCCLTDAEVDFDFRWEPEAA